jgi:hypothetical protein
MYANKHYEKLANSKRKSPEQLLIDTDTIF